MADFNSDNTSRGDFKILNSGASDHYAVLFKGEISNRERIGLRMNVIQQETVIRVYQRYKNDGTSQIALQDLIDSIKTALNPVRIIGDTTGTIQSAMIVEERDMMQVPVDAPQWLYVELLGMCDEEEELTFTE